MAERGQKQRPIHRWASGLERPVDLASTPTFRATAIHSKNVKNPGSKAKATAAPRFGAEASWKPSKASKWEATRGPKDPPKCKVQNQRKSRNILSWKSEKGKLWYHDKRHQTRHRFDSSIRTAMGSGPFVRDGKQVGTRAMTRVLLCLCSGLYLGCFTRDSVNCATFRRNRNWSVGRRLMLKQIGFSGEAYRSVVTPQPHGCSRRGGVTCVWRGTRRV